MEGQDFLVQLLAKLDTSSVNKDYEQIKKRLLQDPIVQKFTLDTSMSKQAIKEIASEYHKVLTKEFEKSGIGSINLSEKDVSNVLSSAVKESNKISKELDKATSSAEKFLARFNNKTGGALINTKEFKEVESAISSLVNTHSIDKLKSAMTNLENTYNNVVANLRTGSKSLNPFVNAINDMNNMDNTLKGISLEFEKLSTKPDTVSKSIKKLFILQADVNKYEQGTLEWSQAYGKLKTSIQAVSSELINLSKAKTANVSTKIFNIKDLEKQGNVYFTKARNSITKMIPSIEGKFKSLGFSNIEIKGIEDISGKIKSFTVTAKDAEGALKKFNFEREKIKGNGKAQYGFIQSKDVEILRSAISIQEELAQKALNKINLSIDTEKFSKEITQVKSQLSQYGELSGEVFDKAKKSVNDLTIAHEKLKNCSDDKSKIEAEKEYQKCLAKSKNLLSQMKSDKNNEIVSFGDNRRIDIIARLNNYLSKNTAITKGSKRTVQEWINVLESSDDMTVGSIRNINTEFKTLDANMRTSGKLGLSWKDSIVKGISSFTNWASATTVVMGVVNRLRKMKDNIFEVDASMTNLYKVTDETKSKYNQFLDDSGAKAQDLSRSIASLVEQSANWAKLGFDIDQSKKLAETSSIYANVGEVDDETAVADLVTSMKAFNITANDSMNIVDRFNKLGNEFATSAKGIGEGIRNSASALALAGNDIDQSVAMITGMTEITQNASESGNAVKILSMRLRGMKGDLEKLGEESEGIESISKIQTQILNLTNGKVNIFDDLDPTKFKSTYEIIEGISKSWSEISMVDQAELLEIIAGKQRGNSIAALIQAFQSGQVEKALNASLNSDRSAMQEQERWLDGLEAKSKKFEAAFQSLSLTVLNSDMFKGLIDTGTSFINVLNNVLDKVKMIPLLFTGVGAALSAKNFGKCV